MGAKRTRDEDDAEEAFPRGGSGSGGDDLPRGGNTGGGGGGSGRSARRSCSMMKMAGCVSFNPQAHLHEHEDPWNLTCTIENPLAVPTSSPTGSPRRRRPIAFSSPPNPTDLSTTLHPSLPTQATAWVAGAKKVGDGKYVELLKYKNLRVGMKVLGVVTEVNDRGLTVSLPNGLKGTVTRAEASDVLAPAVQEEQEGTRRG